jgi:hypothetical protein
MLSIYFLQLKNFIQYLVLGALALSAASVWAQTVGTTTADILKINDGIRPAAMGGAYTAMGDDLYSINYNPAGISYIKASQIVIFHLDSLAGIQYEYLAFGTAWGSGNVLAANFIYRHMDPIDNQPGNPLVPAVNADDLLGSLSYALKAADNLRLGATAKILKSDLASFSATAVAIDAGAVLDRLPYGIKLGLSVQNLGTAMTFDTNSPSDPLPIYLRFGVGTHQVFEGNRDLNVDIDLIKPSTQGSSLLDQGLQLGLGAEFWLFPELFAVRGGFDIQNIGALYGGNDYAGNSVPGVPNAYNNYTIGCTLTRRIDGDDFSVDIAYDPANFTDTTEDTFFFGLYFKFNQLRIF